MSIRFQCECGKKLKAADDKIGKRVLCPDCGQPVTVPTNDRLRVETLDGGATLDGPQQDSAKTAKELLKLSAAASQEEEESGKPSRANARQRGDEATFTLAEFIRYYGARFVLPVLGIAAAFVLVSATAFWVYGVKPVYPDLYPVSGRVTFNGEPLANAMVTFRSQKALLSDDKIKIGASVGWTDDEGRYFLNYVPNVRGAVTGKHFVEISKTGPDGRETLPAKYLSGKTELEIEVTADREDGYDIALEL